MRITDAGWAAWQNAQSTGTDQITIAEVAFGADGHAIDNSATALVDERARVGAAGGQDIGPQRIHITAVEDSEAAYTIREIGLILSDGTLFAQWSDAQDDAGAKVPDIPYVLTLDIAFDDLPDGAVVIQETEISFPPATEAFAGRIEIATQAEVEAGEDDQRAVTPAKLAGFSATLERRGMVELASGAETRTGSDGDRAVTPLALATLTATASRRGLIEIATDAETQAGSDSQRAVSPQALAALTATTDRRGLVELSTGPEVEAGTDGSRAVTPAALSSLAATTARRGLIEIATDAEAEDGEDTQRAITPAQLAAALAAADQGDFPVTTVFGRDGDVLAQSGDYNAGQIDETGNAKIMTGGERDKLAHLSVSTATDLDAIRTRVNELDAAVVLQGEWDPGTGAFPGGGSAQPGHSWIANADGTVDGVEFREGDRVTALVVNASSSIYADEWLKQDYTDRVSTVHGRTGAVTGQSGDYTAEQIAETAAAKIMTAAERSKLDGIETGATSDQTDAEIETAYNNRVPAASQSEAEGGTGTSIRRWTPERVRQAIDALGGGTIKLLVSATANDDAVVEFTGVMDGTYPEYVLVLESVVPAAEAYLRMELHQAGSGWLTNNQYRHALNGSIGGAGGNDGNSKPYVPLTFEDNASGVANNPDGGVYAHLHMAVPNLGKRTQIHGQISYYADNFNAGSAALGAFADDVSVDGARFYFDTGNIQSGVFRIYGVSG
ncbi:MAG: hypothetical protein RLO53_13670 [Salinisphaeraceae bacterium]